MYLEKKTSELNHLEVAAAIKAGWTIHLIKDWGVHYNKHGKLVSMTPGALTEAGMRLETSRDLRHGSMPLPYSFKHIRNEHGTRVSIYGNSYLNEESFEKSLTM